MASTQKRTWIIGASSGIGKQLALDMAARGETIIVSARREEPLAELATSQNTITALALDVASPDQLASTITHLANAGKLPSHVIFCAAIYQPGGLEILNHATATEHMQVNYLAFTSLLEHLVPHWQNTGGHIAVIASLSGYCGLPKAAIYGPTKAALINLCETLQPDLQTIGIKLTLINPGFVDTPMTRKNSFAMPFLRTPEQASKAILEKLEKKGFEIAFPWQLSWALRLLRHLPYSLYFLITKRMNK
ncbi:SDR family NAD(P)-dependent oxidoreductase [Polycladidibacter hongkongensis]|uniref:SDR family NAD(P)-dependent oxidoreductase n=1 Tax=Polycladidibacter hongkongensis TaxID=1647556 RepID=UPI00082BF7D9|nr:SDR family NAD(P)-dependent oxidoreductase [Pseudovibrio hongkongensis]